MKTPRPLVMVSLATAMLALFASPLVTSAQAGNGNAAPTAQAAARTPFKASPLAEHPGWALAAACFACHGTDGKDDTFGALNVYSKEDFIARMKELKTTEKETEGLMRPHSTGYTDAQIELLADYFSQIE